MPANIRISVPDELKENAEKAFESMGLSLCSGIMIYLAHVVQEQRIPFTVTSLPKTSTSPGTE